MLKNIIIIEQLNLRYTYGQKKVTTKIKGTDTVVYGRETYQLVGFTEHIGEDARSGHYIGYRTETSQSFNDLGGVAVDSFGYALPPEVTDLNSVELDQAKERGYVYLYKKLTNR